MTRNANMTAAKFRAWRLGLALSQADAAKALGLTTRAIKLYEAGTRPDGNGNSRPVPIPRTVMLACAAIEAGLDPIR